MAKKRRKRRSGLSAALAMLQKKFEAQKQKVIKRGIRPLLARVKQLEADLAVAKSEIANYLGVSDTAKSSKTAKTPKASKGKRRPRMKPEQKLAVAQKVYSHLKSKGGDFGQKDLTSLTSPLLMREVVKIWNKANSDKKIKVTGSKATTRYSVA